MGIDLNINNYKVSDLENAYRLIYENAIELLEEAEILFEHKKYARAFTLAHLSSEELSKLPILYRVATQVHFKQKVNWKEVNKDLRNHEGKLRRKMMLSLFANPNHFENKEQFLSSLQEIAELADFFNFLKNASIYAGVDPDKVFNKPSNIVSENLAKRCIKITRLYLKVIEMNDFHDNGFSEVLSRKSKDDYNQLISTIKKSFEK
jgi:AbiV family abortive infection protein